MVQKQLIVKRGHLSKVFNLKFNKLNCQLCISVCVFDSKYENRSSNDVIYARIRWFLAPEWLFVEIFTVHSTAAQGVFMHLNLTIITFSTLCQSSFCLSFFTRCYNRQIHLTLQFYQILVKYFKIKSEVTNGIS